MRVWEQSDFGPRGVGVWIAPGALVVFIYSLWALWHVAMESSGDAVSSDKIITTLAAIAFLFLAYEAAVVIYYALRTAYRIELQDSTMLCVRLYFGRRLRFTTENVISVSAQRLRLKPKVTWMSVLAWGHENYCIRLDNEKKFFISADFPGIDDLLKVLTSKRSSRRAE